MKLYKKILTSLLSIATLLGIGSLGLTSLTSCSPKTIYVKRTKNAKTARTVKSVQSAKTIAETSESSEDESTSSYTVDVSYSPIGTGRSNTYNITVYIGDMISSGHTNDGKEIYSWCDITEKQLSKDLFGIGLLSKYGGFSDNNYNAEKAVLYASTSEAESTTETTNLHTLVEYVGDERIDPTKLEETQELMIKTTVLEATIEDGGYVESSNYKTTYTNINLTITDTIAPIVNFSENQAITINQLELLSKGDVTAKNQEKLDDMLKSELVNYIDDDSAVTITTSISDDALSYINKNNFDQIVKVYNNKIPFTYTVSDIMGNSAGTHNAYLTIGVSNFNETVEFDSFYAPGSLDTFGEYLARHTGHANVVTAVPSEDTKLLGMYATNTGYLKPGCAQDYKYVINNEQKINVEYYYNDDIHKNVKLICYDSEDGKFTTTLSYSSSLLLTPNYKYTEIDMSSDNVYNIESVVACINKLDFYDKDNVEDKNELEIFVFFTKSQPYDDGSYLIGMDCEIKKSKWHARKLFDQYFCFRKYNETPLENELPDGCIVDVPERYCTVYVAFNYPTKAMKFTYNADTSSWEYTIVDYKFN